MAIHRIRAADRTRHEHGLCNVKVSAFFHEDVPLQTRARMHLLDRDTSFLHSREGLPRSLLSWPLHLLWCLVRWHYVCLIEYPCMEVNEEHSLKEQWNGPWQHLLPRYFLISRKNSDKDEKKEEKKRKETKKEEC